MLNEEFVSAYLRGCYDTLLLSQPHGVSLSDLISVAGPQLVKLGCSWEMFSSGAVDLSSHEQEFFDKIPTVDIQDRVRFNLTERRVAEAYQDVFSLKNVLPRKPRPPKKVSMRNRQNSVVPVY